MEPISAGIIAGGSLLGGTLGSIFGSNSAAASNAAAERNMWQQYQFQKEFATNGIRWKVEDAKAAGLHPLYALGGSGATYSPQAVAHTEPDTGGYLSKMGQDVSRAVAATQTAPERQLTDFQKLSQAQQLEHGNLVNEGLRFENAARAARLSPGQIGPPMPRSTSPVQGTSSPLGTYEAKPPEVLNAQPTNSGAQAGPSQPSVRWDRNPDGSVYAMPTGNMDDFSSPGYMNFQYQNRVLPALSSDPRLRPPDHMLPKGAIGWTYNFPGNWMPKFHTSAPGYGEGVHYAPRQSRKALPRVINNP